MVDYKSTKLISQCWQSGKSSDYVLLKSFRLFFSKNNSFFRHLDNWPCHKYFCIYALINFDSYFTFIWWNVSAATVKV